MSPVYDRDDMPEMTPERTDAIRETLLKGADSAVEARTAGAWLAHSLAAEAGGEIQLNRPSDEVLVIGAALPGHS